MFLFSNVASEVTLWRAKRAEHEVEKHKTERLASEATTVDSTAPASASNV
jgi:hypothetical protein